MAMFRQSSEGRMSPKTVPMELEAAVDSEDASSNQRLHDLWPLGEVDPKRARFPCCIVWTPLPIVSWLAPYIGHVGIGREDGAVLDFAGSNFVSEDNFAYGAVARYLQLDRKQCCFPPNLAGHTCEQNYRHAERGTAISWDDALHSSMQHFQHKYYNLFTCNCHSFVANCLNRLAYNGCVRWNVVTLASLILWRGKWVDGKSVVRSFLPFVSVLCIGILMAGWPFLIGMAVFSSLLVGWFLFGIYCTRSLIE
ncbi:protein REVERSION-TO-ETHYLENE SENSITIVITY1 [Phoenix dactylifera]|uniref:Protein REVERSION-TO-ETHYLENE SENSITIVITY1 n=1 Tax=Phoenix dactylifera TaxID=42345 RepID=A0A8B7CF10_PHODC|nr:protein REVERSION-TO-ETHYLENE SENSITIVITY1 [Phoenix dactylifera]XP_008797717.1 protein REVERSION-TO-ETHYLENE SENSITIVITY1 [Phoenix dactylifera]XP_008797719.1 protein REVERSION-TO-ETHYLENE SENSITIVITY1 [Phoenix dactylifera]XP_008797724.1 protein REVERSION-TO-ETHYLENE SENSITIVITY1 [Phoenix dactylifera]XP_008797726.1 protein REVERSION-TO-ETHYLENE SENSITIVITY1 [Phoenix dactylifera]XP_008797727.1 protein REVERSION-TO-ETHYLENE SENSITIVITY1 [Phoenix dactylifera]XP_008797729.1 protein REVERSION-TO